jgi:hypothetical protein
MSLLSTSVATEAMSAEGLLYGRSDHEMGISWLLMRIRSMELPVRTKPLRKHRVCACGCYRTFVVGPDTPAHKKYFSLAHMREHRHVR